LFAILSEQVLNSPSEINGLALQAGPFPLTILRLGSTAGHFFATLDGLG
jgi:hypothetical protein